MTPERLAEIQERAKTAKQVAATGTVGSPPNVDGLTINEALELIHESAEDVPALLAEVDRLTVEVARLRAGIAAFATDAASFGDHAPRCSDRNCLYDYSIRNQRRAAALLNPTEGDDHADA